MMSQSERLTDDENATMRILWDRGGPSVSEPAMATRQPADTTPAVLPALRRQRAVERQQAGLNIVYPPCLHRETPRTPAPAPRPATALPLPTYLTDARSGEEERLTSKYRLNTVTRKNRPLGRRLTRENERLIRRKYGGGFS